MNRLRTQLIAIFAAATLAPSLITIWIALSLLHRSLDLSSTRELDELSQSVQHAGKELYQRARDGLKQDAASGRAPHATFSVEANATWPSPIREFWDSRDAERFRVAGEGGDRLDFLVRRGDAVWMYSTSLHGVDMHRLSSQFARARATIEAARGRDLRRGFTYTLVSLAVVIWIVSLSAAVYVGNRISRPVRRLTKGLSAMAAGKLDYRVEAIGAGEVGAAIHAFNAMAEQLEQSRERLVYMTRMESWQALARKMAHEIKNSLTPIRLTMEEIAARYRASDAGFVDQAAQIVVDEVMSLERRVRAFSELGAEPPVSPRSIDVNQLLEERIALLKAAHPEVSYSTRLAEERPCAFADEDLVKGVLTNLLENAAQAGETVLGVTAIENGRVRIEIHDSGPGLSAQARHTLFEPTISFKRGGMGLGLSIARKSAVLSGGEILLVEGELGGAGFRVLLPAA
jgi:nitrogen fixation/metabolism regulation signal transduction histidine kinase